MEPIIYKPFGAHRLIVWVLVVISLVPCFFSLIFILSAPLLLVLAFLIWKASKVTVMLDDAGARILHEKTCVDRFVPWEALQAYRLDNDLRGRDILVLSPTPMPEEAARWLINRRYLSAKLWFDGVLVLPLSGIGNAEAVRKLAYQKCIHK